MIAPRSPTDPPRAWTVADLLSWTEAHFRRLSFPAPRLDAEVLLSHALGCTRLELYTGYGKVVEPAERERFRGLVERRGRGEPVAYIVGFREFRSLRFEVDPSVLVPRPETEHLVDAALAHLAGAAGGDDPREPAGAAAPREVRVLDLGTGSGNIAVAVAVAMPGARIVAVDSSASALAVARRNAAAHAVAERIEFLEGDLLAPVAAGDPLPLFEAILSNPPYIPPRERPALPRDVRDFEPPEALFDRRGGGDGDGLGFYRAIAAEAPRFLAPGGLLAVEVGAGQAAAVEDLFRGAGLGEVRSIADYARIPRVVLGLAAGGPPPAGSSSTAGSGPA